MTLYHEVAGKISALINADVYPSGSRLPGVRRLSQQFGVSISTIVQAQRQLENRGLISARPRSGYYVCEQQWEKPALPQHSQAELKPVPVTGQELVLQLAKSANQDDFIQLGAAVPDTSLLPLRAIQRSITKASRYHNQQIATYTFPPGLPELQQQIARRMHLSGCQVAPEQILITNGCQESLSLALQTVARPGDIIAVESPTFYGLLQVIEALGMKALEIPTDPSDGLSIRALELALEQWPVKACVLIPNYSNPLGCLMPATRKQQLVALAQRHNMLLIEDDVYQGLGFSGEYPPALFSLDQQDQGQNVIYCSSFAKTISPGLRVGWMVLPDKLYQRAEYLKYVSNLATPTLPQMAVSDFLQQGGYERYLRRIQPQYADLTERFARAISQYFPANTRVSRPVGGFVIWVELDERIDTLKLTQEALQQRISIAPGIIFSATQKYRHCIRLNCALPWTAGLTSSLQTLGELCLRHKT
ncbi:MAG: PLP-dependent aminotransferase family protein [Thiolinea sp.]